MSELTTIIVFGSIGGIVGLIIARIIIGSIQRLFLYLKYRRRKGLSTEQDRGITREALKILYKEKYRNIT